MQPLSGHILAEFSIRVNTTKQVKETTECFRVWHHFAHDIFSVIDSNYEVEEVVLQFSVVHSSLQFISKVEMTTEVPFLDLLVTRNGDGHIQYATYGNKTWSGHPTNCHSFVHARQKANLPSFNSLGNLSKRGPTLRTKHYHQCSWEQQGLVNIH